MPPENQPPVSPQHKPQSEPPFEPAEDASSHAPKIMHDQTELIDDASSQRTFTWQASEFVHHDKPAVWYVGLLAIAAVLIVALVLLRQWFGIAVIAVMTLAIMVYSRKQPRTLSYAIDDSGVSIEGRMQSYDLFRTYSVLEEVGWREIDLEPAKRFAPRLTLLTERESFDQIESILASHLPRQDRAPDMIERASRYLKF